MAHMRSSTFDLAEPATTSTNSKSKTRRRHNSNSWPDFIGLIMGFLLSRWLKQEMSLATVVPGSGEPVSEPQGEAAQNGADRRQEDGVCATGVGRGEAVLSRVRVSSVEEEDRKRLLRERQRLVKERTSLANAIKGLLKLQRLVILKDGTGRACYRHPWIPNDGFPTWLS